VVLRLVEADQRERGHVIFQTVDEVDAWRGRRGPGDGHAKAVQFALEFVRQLFASHRIQVEPDANSPVASEVLVAGRFARDAVGAIAVRVAGLSGRDTVAEGVPIALNAKGIVPGTDSPIFVDEGPGRAAAIGARASGRIAGTTAARGSRTHTRRTRGAIRARIPATAAIGRIAHGVDTNPTAIRVRAALAGACAANAKAPTGTSVVATTTVQHAAAEVHTALPALGERRVATGCASAQRAHFRAPARDAASAAMAGVRSQLHTLSVATGKTGLAGTRPARTARPGRTGDAAATAMGGIAVQQDTGSPA